MSNFSAQLQPLASEVIDKLTEVATAAKGWLNDSYRLGPGALAAGGNTFHAPGAVRALQNINKANEAAYQQLAEEPAIARVVAEDEGGRRDIFYFCRADQGLPQLRLISYRAPVGRLAALPVGEEFLHSDGRILTVVERAGLSPSAASTSSWDARTVFQSEEIRAVTIESLRELLKVPAAQDSAIEDFVSKILEQAKEGLNVVEGIKRSVITKMGLRDQPVLDRFQDEIFRLPLNQRVALLGPPGTGKTTTLIRRLGQKLDTAFLDEDEQRIVQELSEDQQIPHSRNWLMFTPTELLKQYLKEAFAREGIPAPDSNIQTWSDHRRDLARQTFSVLRSASSTSAFVLKDVASLRAEAAAEPIAWFEDFQAWQGEEYLSDLMESANTLAGASQERARKLGVRLRSALQEPSAWPTRFSSLVEEVSAVQEFVSELKEESDNILKDALNFQIRQNRALVDELKALVESLNQQPVADAEQDDEIEDEEEEAAAPRVGASAAVHAYMQALRAQARSAVTKRSINRSTRNGRILSWLGERTLPADKLVALGTLLLTQSKARKFVNPVRRYLYGVSGRYRAFRRMRQGEGKWYAAEGFESRDLNPLELDIVLLAILRSAGELLRRPSILRSIDNPGWSSLKPVLGALRLQVVVDEATDFSPIQLACMGALAHPRMNSFFACGDFNQRLTNWGSRNADQLKWVFPDFDLRQVSISYRQSRQLNDLAHDIVRYLGGSEQQATLPAEVDNEGVPPALLEHTTGESKIRWLADRIRWIEGFLERGVPSTAVFVNSEAEVEPLAKLLNDALVEQNIPVVACREGQTVGVESNVRVFDVQHIKGLEFEAVFFVGIDQLAVRKPELFDKFLFVGATRAAQYLGVTCTGALPQALEPLRGHFVTAW